MINDILKKIENIISEGNIRRININDQKGEKFIEMPLLIGVILTIASPYVVAIGALVGYATKFSVKIVKKEDHEDAVFNEINTAEE